MKFKTKQDVKQNNPKGRDFKVDREQSHASSFVRDRDLWSMDVSTLVLLNFLVSPTLLKKCMAISMVVLNLEKSRAWREAWFNLKYQKNLKEKN